VIERTPEQVAADEALTHAIERTMAAYHFGAGMVTDYVVALSAQRLTDDGGTLTTYGSLYRDSGMSSHVILGLLRCATLQAEHAFNEDDDLT
jgi:hypothetical protein